jgi:hypothetical protein
MSDTNFSYMEVSAKRKKRNQAISILIIVAIVLLAVIVWGWIELEKSRNAERIKNALNSQVEPGFREPDIGPDPVLDTGSLVVEDVPPAAEVVPPVAEPARPPVETAPSRPVEPRVVEKPAQPKVVEAPASKPAEPKAVESPAPVKEPVAKAQPTRPKEPVQVAMHRADPIPEPAKPGPKAEAKPAPAPAKAFPPEDLPLPAKPEATEETRHAVASMPKAAEPEAAAEASPSTSNNFRLGMAAYRQQDYVNAIRSFASVPKPSTRKRGAPERDEYVQANFLRGVALLKVGHMSEAVTAFHNVLEFEKYYPMANMNLGICYVELKQYAKAHQAFEAVIRDQNRLEPATYDDVMQRTKYFWALAWTRLYKNSTNPDKQNYYRTQAIQKWKDYQIWFSKNEKYKEENLKAENYLKSLSSL